MPFTKRAEGYLAQVNSRISSGVRANIYGQLVSVLIQILPVPLLIYYWGIDLYGVWILINAVAAYFVLCDMGLGSVAGNVMMMDAARDKFVDVQKIFQSTWIVVTIVSLAVFFLVVFLLTFLPLEDWFNYRGLLAHEDIKYSVTWLILYSLWCVQGNMILQVYRCSGKYGRGVFAENNIRIVENITVIVGVLIYSNIQTAAFALMLTRMLGTLAMGIDVYRLSPWWRWKHSFASLAIVLPLIRPAVAYSLFPLANSIIIQGITLLVGFILGPSQVVVFNVMRTITRATVQASGVIKHGIWPEISRAFGLGDLKLIRLLHRWAVQISLVLGLAITILLTIFGPWVYEFLTHNQIAWDWKLFSLLQLVALINCIWYPSITIQLAKNAHETIAIINFVASLIGMLLSLVGGYIWSKYGVILGLLVFELIMAIAVPMLTLKLLREDIRSFIQGIKIVS